MLLLFNFKCRSDMICHHFKNVFFTLWQIKMFACAYLESGHICHCTHTHNATLVGAVAWSKLCKTMTAQWIRAKLMCTLHLLTTVRAGAFNMSLASLSLRLNVSVILHGRIILELGRAQWKGAENRRSPIQWILKNDVSDKTMSP